MEFLTLSSSFSSVSSFTNMKASSSYRYGYRYVYRPRRKGSFTFPGAELRIAGRNYRINSVNVEVTDLGISPSQPNIMEDNDIWDFNQYRSGESYLIAIPEKRRAYLGEPLVISYYIYTNQEVSSLTLDEEKDHDGYGKIVYEAPKELKSEYVTHQGKRMRRALVHRLAILPNTAGKLRVPTVSVTARFWGFSFGNNRLASQDLFIEAIPLPENGKPANFSGAIGSFQITEALSSREVNQGEPTIYSFRIKGKGNFNQFTPPVYPPSPGMQISSPYLNDNLSSGIFGERSISYTIIPQNKGEFKLPGITFTWFDTAQGSYRTFRSADRSLKVNPGSLFSDLFRSQTPLRILPLIELDSYPQFRDPLRLAWFRITLAAILSLLLFSGLWALQKSERFRHPEAFAEKQARLVLKKYLEEANQARKNQSREFYTLAESGLTRFVCNRFKIPYGLSLPEKYQELSQKGLPAELIRDLAVFLERCQKARYAPLILSSHPENEFSKEKTQPDAAPSAAPSGMEADWQILNSILRQILPISRTRSGKVKPAKPMKINPVRSSDPGQSPKEAK